MLASMRRSLAAGLVYFLIVFAFAFAMGALRVSLIAPRIGDLAAVALEVPMVLAISWIVSGWLTGRMGAGSLAQAIAMGAWAFVLLQVTEAALSVLMFGNTLAGHLGGMMTPAGALGLAGQAAFGLMPAVRWRLSARVRKDRP